MALEVLMFSEEDEFPWGLTTLISYPPLSLPLPVVPHVFCRLDPVQFLS